MPVDSDNIVTRLLAVGKDDAPAIFFKEEALTYGEVRRKVDNLARALLHGGSAKGDRIGLFCDNVPFFVISYLAAIRAGLCCVPFPPGTNESMFRDIIKISGMRRTLVQKKYARHASKWSEGLEIELLPEAEIPLSSDQNRRTVREKREDQRALDSIAIDPCRDLAVIVFTSGSTGRPKGVMVTHGNVACNTEDIVSYMSLTENNRVLAVLPFSYCFGASLLHTHFRVGGSVVLCNSFMFPEKVVDDLESKECTGFAGVPATYQILLRKTRFAQRTFPKLRWLQQAGGMLPIPLIKELRLAHPEVRLFVMYGQTEATARLSYLPPEMLDTKIGSIGLGLPSVRLEVLRKNGTAVEPGSGDVGEIVASGENISAGYWSDPEETAKFFRNGRLHTGDIARVDEDGYIYVVDRARDFIKSMGNRVSSQEIEEVIASHPDVLHVAGIGVPDDLWGEAIATFVVPRSQGLLTEDKIKTFCKKLLPNYKVPQHVCIVNRLPTNGFGKVMKEKLRATWRHNQRQKAE